MQVVHDLSFSLGPGEFVGVVGESGCGKSVTALSILRLLPERDSRIGGEIRFEGRDLLALSEREMAQIRGRRIAMVFQEPMSALDPTFVIGEQIAETIRAHFPLGRAAARERAIDMLDRVGIPAPRQRYHSYPRELSGGMRQRVMIAIALSCEPSLLIADEPTTALDVTIQAQIIDLMLGLAEQSQTALMLITHDLSLVSGACSRVLTMYGGVLVEDGRVESVLRQPRHPYTSGLLRAMPGLAAPKSRLPSIGGRVLATRDGDGCNFRDRCLHQQPRCAHPQPMRELGHAVRCCRAAELVLAGALS